MKKLFASIAFLFTIGICSLHAQEVKEKPVTTVGDKVHNTVHPKHKVAHGKKYKHKSAAGTVTTSKRKTPAAKPMTEKKKEKTGSN